jgi:hypothetical protein
MSNRQRVTGAKAIGHAARISPERLAAAYVELALGQRMRAEEGPIAHDETLQIYPSLGRMSYWHLADVDHVCTGSIAERAGALWEIVRTSGANFQKWPLTPQQIRAMTLELAAASAQRGEPCGSDLLHLMAWAMDVPESFLYDPTEVLSGRDGKGRGVDPMVRQSAEFLDTMHLQKTGKYMSAPALVKATGASRRSIREWVKGWRK